MDFCKNLSKNQERRMYKVKHKAICVSKNEINNYIEYKCTHFYLKKIKQLDSDNFLILISKNFEKEFLLVDVPAFQPETKEQIEAAAKIWPCIYKKEQKDVISTEKIQIIKREGNIFLNKSEKYFDKNSECVCKCVFLNFKDNIFDNSMETNTINLKDSIEQEKINQKYEKFEFYANKDFFSRHPLLRAISEISKSTSNYLCTGMSLILDREPCYSCAMALVHGRILDVFILRKNKNGIFSKYKFNFNKHINHRFDVYFSC